jgi:hypothetical protein
MSMHYLVDGVNKIDVLSEYEPSKERNSLYSANTKSYISQIIYTGQSCNFLISTLTMGVEIGRKPKLG